MGAARRVPRPWFRTVTLARPSDPVAPPRPHPRRAPLHVLTRLCLHPWVRELRLVTAGRTAADGSYGSSPLPSSSLPRAPGSSL